jgi:hypothetical protein
MRPERSDATLFGTSRSGSGRKGGLMSSFDRDDLPVVFESEGVGKACHLAEGPMTLQWESWEAGMDARPLYRGLPDDRCQCHHYGYVIRGSLRFETADGEQVLRAGQAYHLAPGHLPLPLEESVEVVEFTDSAELGKTMAAFARNLEGAHDQPVGELA